MDYYEELGVHPSASFEEIRSAYSRLRSAFQPDDQADESMRQLAEAQVRRLGAIVGILTDPELRRQYDKQRNGMADPHAIATISKKHSGSARKIWQPGYLKRRLFPWRVLIGPTALVLIIGLVWFWDSDFEISLRSAKNSQSQPSVKSRSNLTEKAAPSGTGHGPTKFQNDRVSAPPSRGAQSESTVQIASIPETRSIQRLSPLRKQINAVPLPPTIAPENMSVPPPPDIALNGPTIAALAPASFPVPVVPITPAPAMAFRSSVHQDPLAGEWVYAPKEAAQQKPGSYEAEFINLKLFWNNGELHGEYIARYRVVDKPVSPDVRFVLSASDPNSRKFVWQSRNGSRGTLKIRPINPGTIQVDWRTTVYSTEPVLTAGSAMLVRHSQ